jgi:hypothetical protein
MLQLLGLFLGLAWGLYRIALMIGLPSSKIIGEGLFYFIVIAFPLFAIAVVHSLFLGINSRLPVLYGIGIGFLLLCLAIPYRIHFQDGNTIVANGLLLLASLVLASASTAMFFIAPFLRWLVGKFILKRT